MGAERLTDEHILRLANQAIAKAKVPSDVMSYDDCLESALYGIAEGYRKFREDNFQSTREWLSMQAYYQIKTDLRKRLKKTSREAPLENADALESERTRTTLEEMEHEERAHALETLLSTLKRRERLIVTRIAIDGETFTQVAKSLRMKRTEVQKRYKDSLDFLRATALLAAASMEYKER